MFNNSNRRQFQKGLDTEKARAQRCDIQLSLRRKQREERLQKKVRMRLTKKTSSFDEKAGEDLKPEPLKKDISIYIANVMQSENPPLQLFGLSSIRKLLSTDREPPTKLSQHICFGAILPKIIQFMYNNNKTEMFSQLAFESAWTITNICAGTNECTMRVVKYGGIEALVHLLHTEGRFNREMATQAIWGLGNISSNGAEIHQRIFSTGVITNVVEIIDESANLNSELQSIATWFMSNILRVANVIKLRQIKELNLVCILCRILRRFINYDEEIIENCLWIFNFLSARSEQVCAFMVGEGSINIVMKLLTVQVGKYEVALNQSNNAKTAMLSLNCKIYRPCLRFIGNVLSCGDLLTQSVLDCGYLDVIEPFTYHFIAKQRKEVMWSLSNILAGTPVQIGCILEKEQLIRSIINCAKNDVLSVKVEACYGICNIVNDGNTFQKKQLAEYGGIEALCSLLNPINDITEQNMLVIIEGLESFLATFGDVMNINPFAQQIEECQGLDYLEARSTDNTISEETWHSIINLMHKYWGELQQQPEIPCVINPNINGKQFEFGTNAFNNTSFENDNSFRFNF